MKGAKSYPRVLAERKRVYDYLVDVRGWSPLEARLVIAHPRSFTYASARLNAACHELGRTITKALVGRLS